MNFNKNRKWLEATTIIVILLGVVIPANSALALQDNLSSLDYSNMVVFCCGSVSGGEADARDHPTHGGSGGLIDIRTGVDVDIGDGSDGDLTAPVVLTSGVYNFRQVLGSAITVDGDVTIKCQFMFFPSMIDAIFRPDSPPPSLTVHAGTNRNADTNLEEWHIFVFDMVPVSGTRSNSSYIYHSDGSGIDGGIFRFYTTARGDIVYNSLSQGMGGKNGGNGGNGGNVTLVAKDASVMMAAAIVANGGYGANGCSSNHTGGGQGGDGGKIVIVADSLGCVDTVVTGNVGFYLDVNGGEGGDGAEKTRDHPNVGNVGNGGNGGMGGGIRSEAIIEGQDSRHITANGGDGGHGTMFVDHVSEGGQINGGDGCRGGNGGKAGTLIGITGTATPGNGGDGGPGGDGLPGQPGGNGGTGGQGGDSGGPGGQPGTGGRGGDGSWGEKEAPDGEDGLDGQDGIVGQPQTISLNLPNPPESRITAVLSVGSSIPVYRNKHYYDAGMRNAMAVENAFAQFPRVQFHYFEFNINSSTLEHKINSIKAKLKKGDTFVLYIISHGGSNLDGNEHEVQTIYESPIMPTRLVCSKFISEKWLEYLSYWVDYDIYKFGLLYQVVYRLKTTGDEFLKLSKNSFITDDELTALFSDDDKWKDINKLFIIDACRAGGFWGGKDGDLDSLKKVALIAACSEEELAGIPVTEIKSVLCKGLVNVLEYLEGSDTVTFIDLKSLIEEEVKAVKCSGQNITIMPVSPPDMEGIVIPLNSIPVSFASSDFDSFLIGEDPNDDIRPPSAPRNLSATSGDGYVELEWDTPSDNGCASITDYSIYRGTSSGSLFYYYHTEDISTSYVDSNAENGTSYYYRVSAVNSVGRGDKSNEASATPGEFGVAEIEIEQILVKAGKGRNLFKDSFKLSAASFGVTETDLADAERIYVDIYKLEPDEEHPNLYTIDENPVFSDVINFDPENLKNGRFKEKNTTTRVNFDLNKQTLQLSAKKIDLTGLHSPVVIEIEIGDYFCSGTAYDGEVKGTGGSPLDMINGRKSMPIQLLSGCADSLHVDKCEFKLGTKKPSTDSLTIQGAIAVKDASVNIAGEDIVVSWGDYEITLPANNLYRIGSKKAFKYKKPKGIDSSIASAIFDLEKCTFKIIIKKADIGPQDNSVVFGLQFGDFIKNETLTLTEKRANLFVCP